MNIHSLTATEVVIVKCEEEKGHVTLTLKCDKNGKPESIISAQAVEYSRIHPTQHVMQ